MDMTRRAGEDKEDWIIGDIAKGFLGLDLLLANFDGFL